MTADLPACDRIRVTVLVDNVLDILSSTPPNVTPPVASLRAADPAWRFHGTCLCCANWGLSLVVEAWRGTRSAMLLFDAGPDGATLRRNARLLGIDWGRLDALVLSHGHWDHAGGLGAVLASRPKGAPPIPFHANRGMFVRRGVRTADGVVPFRDPPGLRSLARGGARPDLGEQSRLIAGGLMWLSGEIPRVTPFETGFPGHMCWSSAEAVWKDDPLILDERWLALRLKGKGLVILSACSHAGIVNVLADARRSFPEEPIHAVIGGLHLAGANETVIPQTVEGIRAAQPGHVIPLHCTGWRAVAALHHALGDRVTAGSVGQVHRFDA